MNQPVIIPVAVSPREAATLLGMSPVSYYRHIHGYVLSGEIKSLKVGRMRRIVVASLMAWVERNAHAVQ